MCNRICWLVYRDLVQITIGTPPKGQLIYRTRESAKRVSTTNIEIKGGQPGDNTRYDIKIYLKYLAPKEKF